MANEHTRISCSRRSASGMSRWTSSRNVRRPAAANLARSSMSPLFIVPLRRSAARSRYLDIISLRRASDSSKISSVSVFSFFGAGARKGLDFLAGRSAARCCLCVKLWAVLAVSAAPVLAASFVRAGVDRRRRKSSLRRTVLQDATARCLLYDSN